METFILSIIIHTKTEHKYCYSYYLYILNIVDDSTLCMFIFYEEYRSIYFISYAFLARQDLVSITAGVRILNEA